MVVRFYWPNFKVIFANNMYYHTDFKDGNLIEIKNTSKRKICRWSLRP